jgi:hypothetical protein
MGLRGFRAAHEILAERRGSANQMISDIRVKRFLTRGGEGSRRRAGIEFEEIISRTPGFYSGNLPTGAL